MAALNRQTVQQAASQPGSPRLIYHPRPEVRAPDVPDAPDVPHAEPDDISSKLLVPGVVHLGLGGFHRAHQAMVFDALIAQGDHRWAVCAVGMRSDKLTRQLQAQDHLYLVRISDANGSQWHVPSAIVNTLVAATDRDAVVDQIASPYTRWVTLTVTEKAYTRELAQLIVAGLHKRMAAGLAGITIASCDNLPDNGRVLQTLCLTVAQEGQFDESLRHWIQTKCRFPVSMVDRIVPAPSDEVRQAGESNLGLDDPTALGVESFWEWVIEDAFVDPTDADALRSVGVVVTDDVAGFEQAKLWMLNGSHTVLASAGAVLDDTYIREVIARPTMRQFVHGFMTHASGPLVGRPRWQAYREALIERFGNPMIDHACLQVYSDSSQKIPVRWVPVGERLLAMRPDNHQLGLDYLAMAVAIFARSLWPVGESGEPFVFNDPMASELQALARDQQDDPAVTIRKLLRDTKGDTKGNTAGNTKGNTTAQSVFGHELGDDEAFVKAACDSLASIHALGLEAAVTQFVTRPGQGEGL